MVCDLPLQGVTNSAFTGPKSFTMCDSVYKESTVQLGSFLQSYQYILENAVRLCESSQEL